MDDKKASEEAMEKLQLAELLTKLEGLELPDPTDTRTPMQVMTDELKASRPMARKIKQRTAKPEYQHSATCSGRCRGTCGTRHWKTKRRKKNEYYQNTVKYRRLELKGELLEAGSEGWWVYLTRLWKRHKVPVEMTYEEWNEHIWPALAEKNPDGTAKPGSERIPIIRRYQTRKPIQLGNVYVTESGREKHVLFDGKEFLLKQQGYIL